MNNQKPIYELHANHAEWLSKLSFYKDEISIMGKRIEEINAKNSKESPRAMIEHFQNQLIIQKEQIDILQHDIKQQEQVLDQSISQNMVAADHRKITDLPELRERMIVFEKIFNELRKEQADFVAKWL